MQSPMLAHVLLTVLLGIGTVAESAELKPTKLVVAKSGGAAFTFEVTGVDPRAPTVRVPFDPPFKTDKAAREAVAGSVRLLEDGRDVGLAPSTAKDGISVRAPITNAPGQERTFQLEFTRMDVALVYKNEFLHDASQTPTKTTIWRQTSFTNPLGTPLHAKDDPLKVVVVDTLDSLFEIHSIKLEASEVLKGYSHKAPRTCITPKWRVKVATPAAGAAVSALDPVRASFDWTDKGLGLPQDDEDVLISWRKDDAGWRSLPSTKLEVVKTSDNPKSAEVRLPVFRLATAKVATHRYVTTIQDGLLTAHDWHVIKFDESEKGILGEIALEPFSSEWRVCKKEGAILRERTKNPTTSFIVELPATARGWQTVLTNLKTLHVENNSPIARAIKLLEEIGTVRGVELEAKVEQFNTMVRMLPTKTCENPSESNEPLILPPQN